LPGSATGYVGVYALEITLLLVTIVATAPLVRRLSPVAAAAAARASPSHPAGLPPAQPQP
jgi:hypothetical protein